MVGPEVGALWEARGALARAPGWWGACAAAAPAMCAFEQMRAAAHLQVSSPNEADTPRDIAWVDVDDGRLGSNVDAPDTVLRPPLRGEDRLDLTDRGWYLPLAILNGEGHRRIGIRQQRVQLRGVEAERCVGLRGVLAAPRRARLGVRRASGAGHHGRPRVQNSASAAEGSKAKMQGAQGPSAISRYGAITNETDKLPATCETRQAESAPFVAAFWVLK